MRSSQPQPHSLAGAYVMNALDPAELRRVERHLARCQECAHEVADLREVVGCLAAASVSRPPAEFKARLIARTPMIRQLPPTVGQQQAGRWRYLPRPRWAGSWPKRIRRLASAPVLAAALALSVAVAALVIAVTGLSVQHGPARQRHADAAITAILTAPDAIMISAAVRTAGAATVVMSRSERALVFAAAGLPTPASRSTPHAQPRYDRARDRTWPAPRRPSRPDRGTRQRITTPDLRDDPGPHALRRRPKRAPLPRPLLRG